MKKLSAYLQNLAHDDLAEWAGDTIFSRGQGYIRKVSTIHQTKEGELMAWVKGSDKYATSVMLDDNGGLDCYCTCPYDWQPCKHGVALVLKAAGQMAKNQAFAPADENSELYQAIYDEDDEEAFSSLENDDRRSKLTALLQQKSKKQLIELLLDMPEIYDFLGPRLQLEQHLSNGKVDKLVSQLSKQIRQLGHSDWDSVIQHFDYSALHRQLQALLSQGQGDVLLQLGEQLWSNGHAEINMVMDEGETAEEISNCLEIILQAVPKTSLSRVQQLLWLIDHDLEDEFDLLPGLSAIISQAHYTDNDWEQVAAALEQRLGQLPRPKQTSFNSSYRREKVLNWLLRVYQFAGQEQRQLPLLEREVVACQNYPVLVAKLLQDGEIEQAREWCIKGFKATINDAPGIAGRLQDQLEALARTSRRHDLVAAYQAENFFNSPRLEYFSKLEKVAKKAKCWPQVRSVILNYLETGQRPEHHETDQWPLPQPEVQTPKNKWYRKSHFPNLRVLLDLAIKEKRAEDVISYYQRMNKPNCIYVAPEVASVLLKTHPEYSLQLWKDLVNSLIAEVKPSAYQRAAPYLRKIRSTYESLGQNSEWQQWLTQLQTEHKAKRKLLEVLSTVARGKTAISS